MARRSTTDRVYDTLRRQVVLGAYRPNQRLIETELAAMLDVSRTPVREALHRLETDGLIVRSRQGWMVYEHGPDEIREIYEIRTAIDSYAARLAALRLTDEGVARLEAITDTVVDYLGHTVDQLVASNEAFHRLILELAGNKNLLDLSDRTSQYYFNFSLAANYTREELQVSRRQHEAIAQALFARDAELASRLVREHTETALRVGLPKLNVPRRIESSLLDAARSNPP